MAASFDQRVASAAIKQPAEVAASPAGLPAGSKLLGALSSSWPGL
jgi:hypothetical protein